VRCGSPPLLVFVVFVVFVGLGRLTSGSLPPRLFDETLIKAEQPLGSRGITCLACPGELRIVYGTRQRRHSISRCPAWGVPLHDEPFLGPLSTGPTASLDGAPVAKSVQLFRPSSHPGGPPSPAGGKRGTNA
jgi:hypothetical protein